MPIQVKQAFGLVFKISKKECKLLSISMYLSFLMMSCSVAVLLLILSYTHVLPNRIWKLMFEVMNIEEWRQGALIVDVQAKVEVLKLCETV